MATKKTNPFDKFTNVGTSKVFIKSLDYEIEYRPLTMAEDDAFNLRLLKGATQTNKQMNMEEASEIKYEKLALMLVDPVVTVEQLKGLQNAGKVIVEILKEIEPEDDLIDNEGN